MKKGTHSGKHISESIKSYHYFDIGLGIKYENELTSFLSPDIIHFLSLLEGNGT
jgi:hypothetical protein